MNQSSEQKLINTYKNFYKIPCSFELTGTMILKHWELEKSLTEKLISSTPQNRWKTFEECYGRLYNELNWLNMFDDSNNRQPHQNFTKTGLK